VIERPQTLGVLPPQGKDDDAERADRERPDQVDADRDSGLASE